MIRFFVCLITAVLLSVPYALCQTPNWPITIVVDEYGAGTFTNPNGTFPITGVLQADPGPGGLSSVMTYSMQGPPSLVAGDVQMFDGNVFLDVIRFNPAGTGSATYPASLLFYSDNTDGFDAPADTPSAPTSFYTNVVSINEIGSEGFNYGLYTPTAGQPGYVAPADSNIYTMSYILVSDGTTAQATTPEPATMLLLGSGLFGLWGARKKFKK